MPLYKRRNAEPLVDLLANFLGKYCEVVLHDFSNSAGSIVKITNGHGTGRSVGGTVTSMALEVFHAVEGPANAFIPVPNLTSYTSDGRRLKSAALVVRRRGKNIGALALNLDVSAFGFTLDFLKEICSGSATDDKVKTGVAFAPDFHSLLDEIISTTLHEKGKPREIMSKKDRLDVLRALDKGGIFNPWCDARGLAQVGYRSTDHLQMLGRRA
jgi:predicted transcriptional regulator YheO